MVIKNKLMTSTWYWVIIFILIILIIVGIVGLIYFDQKYRECLNSTTSLQNELTAATKTIDQLSSTPLPVSGALANIPSIVGAKILATYDASGTQVLNAVNTGSNMTNVKLQNRVSMTSPIATQEWIINSVTGGVTISTGDGSSFWALKSSFAENDKVFLSPTATTFAIAKSNVSSLQVAGNTEFVLTIDGDGDVAIVPSDDMFLPSKLFTLYIFGYRG